MRIGIFGGTFDPVHYGHIKPALHIKQALNLQQLYFVPNKIPPHRPKPWLSVQQRLSLLQTALETQPQIHIDTRELMRDGVSYMVDTLRSIKAEKPAHCLYLIIGIDAFYGITQWHQWRQLFKLCHLVVTQRPNYPWSIFKNNVEYQQLSSYFSKVDFYFLKKKLVFEINSDEKSTQVNGQILLQSVPQYDISSSIIREKWQKKEDMSLLMPKGVIQQLKIMKPQKQS